MEGKNLTKGNLLKNTKIDNLVVLGIGILSFVVTKIILETIYFFSNKWQKGVIEKTNKG